MKKSYVSSELSYLLRKAQQGDVVAQTQLASMYAKGNGVPEDYEKARYWYEQAAAHGDLDDDSLIDLANLYYEDEKVPKNRKRALKWYERAACRGNAWAMNRIGDLYAEGLGGVWHSFPMAEEWYERAAEQGNDEAMYNRGFMYEEGEDYETARKWYERAAAMGNTKAKSSLRDLEEIIKERSDAA
jgi:TPR repeat protein